MRKTARFVALAMLLVLVVGCSQPSPGVEPEEKPDEEQELVLALNASARLIDPHKTTNYADERIMQQTMDCLVYLDYDLATIEPLLAKSWTISDDAKTYVFELRDDVKFHSGKPLTAEDVKYTFDRWRDPETASPTKYKVDLIESVEVEGDYTVKVTLSKPNNTFLLTIASMYGSIVNKEAVESAGEDYGTKVVDGTGPFVFKEWIPDDRIICERNEDYKWGPSIFSNSGPAFAKRLIFRFIPEAGTRLMEFEAGNVDILTPGSTPRAEIERLKKDANISVMPYDQPYSDYIGFKVTTPHLQDVRVRQAMNYAVDREALVEQGLMGLGVPAYGPIAPVTFGYWDGVEEIGYRYDPAKAEALMDEAGWVKESDGFRYKDGKRFVLKVHYCGGQEYDTTVPMAQAYLREVGIDVELIQMEFATLMKAINAGEHEAYVMGLNYPHPNDVLGMYFRSTNRPYPNRFDYANDKVDELLDVGLTHLDKNKQLEAYREIQKIIVEDAVWIPLFFQVGTISVRSDLQAFKTHGIYGIPKLLDVSK